MYCQTNKTRSSIIIMFAVFMLISLVACAQTQYVHEGQEVEPSMMRTVRVDLKDAFYKTAPVCVTVLPVAAASEVSPLLKEFIEQSVARHLSQRVPVAIGPDLRKRWTRRLAVDLTDAGDQRRFLRASKCDAFLQPELMAAADDYFVIWSNKSIDLRLKLFTPPKSRSDKKGELLWITRHAASRGDGSLPLDIASLGIGTFKAGSHHSDAEVQFSLIEDAVRRMMVTLPDTRSAGVDRSRTHVAKKSFGPTGTAN